jgi:hypothetical protein
MQLIKAKKIWENGEFVGENQTVYSFPCEKIGNGTPRDGWLIRSEYCCGMPTTYQLSLTDPKNGSAIRGVWIEFDGNGVLIDAESVDLVVDNCNGCCGAAPLIESRYNNKYPEASAYEQAASYTITRADDGGVVAQQKFRLDYLNEYIEGTLTHVRNGNNSEYTFKAYKDPRKKGTDTISNETARTFQSADAPALGAGQTQLELTAEIDGTELAPKLTGANAAALAAAATGNPAYSAFGTWSAVGSKVQLASTKATQAHITIEGIA